MTFSPFETNIQPNKLKNGIKELNNFCFKGGEKQFIAVRTFDATWIDNKNKFKKTFGKVSLIFFFTTFFLIFVIVLFENLLVFPWVLTQQILW